MTKTPLSALSDFYGRAFAAVPDEYNRAMRRFLSDLRRSEDAYREEVVAQRSKLGVPAEYRDTPDVERYSLAIQIFAAMTVEAGISYYAVMRFGGELHDDHFRWGSAEERLKRALTHAGISYQDDAELFAVIGRRKTARDCIVHPFSAEYAGPTEDSRMPDRPWPDASAVAARRAVADVDRFFLLLRDIDETTSSLLHMF